MIGRTISHYRIVEKLGEGGMGVVYVAEDTHLGRRVAFKTLTTRGGDVQHFRARFLREARAVSALSHPNIAAIYDYGETEEGNPYIVMELIKGETLSDLMHKEKLTIPRSIEIIKEVAEALGEAHSQGIVHRDIKPSNVAINERGKVKVLDFGLAKQLDPGPLDVLDPEQRTLLNTQTREGMILGTPLYLSPEQAMGIEVDARSDLFALGSLLYECITGTPAFSAATPTVICARIMRDDPPSPSEVNSDVPQELDEIVKKALAKKPNGRYQSADGMIEDLENARASILGLDRAVTRMIPITHAAHHTRTLATLSDIFRKPRLSIGYVVAGAVALLILSIGIWYLLRGRPHQPPAEAQALYETGSNAIRSGAYFQASRALTLAVGKDDEFALAHARLAEAWMELDYADRAKDEILRAGQLFQNRSLFSKVDALYLDAITGTVRRDFPTAVNAYSQIAKQQPDQSYVYVDLGRAYEKSNQVDKAVENYTAATNKDPQNATAFLRLGILQGRKRNSAAALAAFDKAETLYQATGNVEGRAEVALQRGVFLNDSAGKVNDARVQLEQARDIAKVVNNAFQQVRCLFQLSSVAIRQGKADEAQQFASEAIQIAQSNQMETLIARGNNELGNVYLGRAQYAEAEKQYQLALEAAQRYGARENEARARLSLASSYIQRGQTDQALPLIDQALAFYQPGNYSSQIWNAHVLRARGYKQKGEYKAAYQSFQDQLKVAEQNGDEQQLAYTHGSMGSLLLTQEQYAEARQHLEESRARNHALGNQLNEGYALVNLGIADWRLGKSDESKQMLDQARQIANQNSGALVGVQSSLLLAEAEFALANRNFVEAEAKARQAFDLTGAQDKPVAVEAKRFMCLSQVAGGRTAAGSAFCQQALASASELADPLLVAETELAAAEATLASLNARQALDDAQHAQTFFSNNGLLARSWRAWLIAGFASQKLGDNSSADSYFKNSGDCFSSLAQKWDADTFKAYQARPDVQFYRKQLEQRPIR